jgi:hypothetical protein
MNRVEKMERTPSVPAKDLCSTQRKDDEILFDERWNHCAALGIAPGGGNEWEND